MSSTIMSRIFSVPCSWFVRYSANAAAAISGICSCSAMASTSSSVRPQKATQSSRVIMPSRAVEWWSLNQKPKRNPDYSNATTSLRRCGLAGHASHHLGPSPLRPIRLPMCADAQSPVGDVHAFTGRVTYIFEHQKQPPLGLSSSSRAELQGVWLIRVRDQCARLFFQDVGSRRVADRGMGSTSDGRRGYSLSGPGPEPTGQIGPPAAVMLLRAGQPGLGGRRR